MLFAGRHPNIAAEQVMQELPGAVLAPTPKIMMDELRRGKIMGQPAPSTAAAHDLKDAVQDRPRGVLLRLASGLGVGHQGLDQVPRFVAEVGRVWCLGVHAPRSANLGAPMQTF